MREKIKFWIHVGSLIVVFNFHRYHRYHLQNIFYFSFLFQIINNFQNIIRSQFAFLARSKRKLINLFKLINYSMN